MSKFMLKTLVKNLKEKNAEAEGWQVMGTILLIKEI